MRFFCGYSIGMDKGRPGRPKLADDERKDSTIRFRAAAEERELFEAAARAQGVKLSEWMRDILLSRAKRELWGTGRPEGDG